jgi:hypothetical protein
MSYELTWEPRGAIKRFYGRVTGKEFEQATTEIEGDERFDDLRFVIVDFSGVTEFSISDASLDYVAAIENAAALTNPKISVGIVASSPEAIKVAEQYASSRLVVYPTQIFPTQEETRAWLAEASLTSSYVLPQSWLHWREE